MIYRIEISARKLLKSFRAEAQLVYSNLIDSIFLERKLYEANCTICRRNPSWIFNVC
jgi:hypothetical protein